MIEVKATIDKIKYSKNKDYKILKGRTIYENLPMDFLVPTGTYFYGIYKFIGEPKQFTRRWKNGETYTEIVMKPMVVTLPTGKEIDCAEFWRRKGR